MNAIRGWVMMRMSRGTLARGLAIGAVLMAPSTPVVAQQAGNPGRLEVMVVDDATGAATAFRARLVDAAGTLAPVPEAAVAIMYGQDDRAEGYERQPDGSFYVHGGFDVALAPGRYRLSVSKGHEYLAEEHEVEVTAGATTTRALRLRRWIDMRARGWFSVDDHVHLRRSPRENPLILTWLAAEDIHVGALLQMGDYHATYFAQYAWGQDGVYQIEDRFLSAGQEDPRTHEIGHTISLGADEFGRSQGQDYAYDRVFDRVRELGGVSGYAHQGVLFHGYRGLTLDVLGGKVDFMEVLQFCGDVQPLETEHYYHFLDLGFRLTATAGSDFPWCGRSNGPQIGNARFYTHVDGALTFDAWRTALRAGHTFVSSGPIVELTVNGLIPGEELAVQPGSTVRVRATARGHATQVPLRDLEVVVHGEVVRRAAAGEGAGQDAATLTLEFDLPVEHGLWIAARASAGAEQFAHTTPVYVTTGAGFHNPARAVELLDRSEGYLREIEGELDGPRHDRLQNAWRYGCSEGEPGCRGEALRERIAETRTTIAELRAQFQGTGAER